MATTGQRRVIRRPKVESHQHEERREKARCLTEWEMEEKPQRHGGLDREVRVLPRRASRARAVRFPGGAGRRGHPDGDVASTDQRAIIGGPVLDVVLCLVRGMDSRLHPSSLVCPLATSLRIRAPTPHPALAGPLEDAGGPDSPDLTPHRRGPGAAAGTPRPRQPARLPPRRRPRPPLAHGVAHGLSGGRGADPLPPRLPAHRRAQPDPRQRPRTGRHAPDRAQEPRHLRTATTLSTSRNCSTPGTNSSPIWPQQAQAVPARRRPHTAGAAAPRTASPLRLVRRGHRVRARGPPVPAGGRGRQWPDTARLCAAARARATDTNRPAIVAHERRGGPTSPNTSTPRARVRVHAGRLDATRRRRATPASGASPHGRRQRPHARRASRPGRGWGPRDWHVPSPYGISPVACIFVLCSLWCAGAETHHPGAAVY